MLGAFFSFLRIAVMVPGAFFSFLKISGAHTPLLRRGRGRLQTYLEGRVSKTWNSEGATHYSYDAHGRVNFAVQEIYALSAAAAPGGYSPGLKTIQGRLPENRCRFGYEQLNRTFAWIKHCYEQQSNGFV
jgi:hypothetical protein